METGIRFANILDKKMHHTQLCCVLRDQNGDVCDFYHITNTEKHQKYDKLSPQSTFLR